MDKTKSKLLTMQKSPSLNTNQLKTPIHKKSSRVLKRISPLIYAQASMTLETAIVLPVFIFFVVTVCCIFDGVIKYAETEVELWSLGNKLVVYSEILDGDILSDYTRFIDGDNLYLKRHFYILPVFDVLPFEALKVENTYYGHMWNGYDLSDKSDSGGEIVYITDTGSVYHTDCTCSYLQLKIRKVSVEEALMSKNKYGIQYIPCLLCGKNYDEEVFIAEEGAAIHSERSCVGLKRTVMAVNIDEVKEYSLCTRCAAAQGD